jgi:hypothetical protein
LSAGANQDRHLQIVAMAERHLRLGQFGAHLLVQRVQPLRPVHARHEDSAVALGLDDACSTPPSIHQNPATSGT